MVERESAQGKTLAPFVYSLTQLYSGFEWMDGYNKVADNSMVNWMPTLTGMRYENQSSEFVSDINPKHYDKEVLDLDSVPFIWKRIKGMRVCVCVITICYRCKNLME
jgi:hypothetical protein